MDSFNVFDTHAADSEVRWLSTPLKPEASSGYVKPVGQATACLSAVTSAAGSGELYSGAWQRYTGADGRTG